jgi:hypothetical protein
MERVPLPESFGPNIAQTLRLLERAHIEGQVEAHGHYAVPLVTVTDTSPEGIAASLKNLNTLIDTMLLGFGVQPEQWDKHLQPDAAFTEEKRITEGMTAAEFLYYESKRNIFSQSEDKSYGGAALLFRPDDRLRIELRGSSQFSGTRIFENPYTAELLHEAEDHGVIELFEAEFGHLKVLDEGDDAEQTFTAFFDSCK